MRKFSILIGGAAGEGIDTITYLFCRLLNVLGYEIFVYKDYPSIIRGGHTFSSIWVSDEKILAHDEKVDILIAFHQEAIAFHKDRLKQNSLVIYDKNCVQATGLGIDINQILQETEAPKLLKNSCLLGALVKVLGISYELLEKVLMQNIEKEQSLNIAVAKKGFEQVQSFFKIDSISHSKNALLTGNEAIGLGLLQSGQEAYISYPMTPTSAILHFMARVKNDFHLKVLQPESEIAVILMALGFSYAGTKVAIGTSGGGFCLMTEGISFSGMAELPLVIVLGQRTGPSTGLPTYTAQSDLFFALYAGHGEFVKFVVAPGDCEEAFFWSSIAMDIAWKYQIVSIILSDKTLSESLYSFSLHTTKPEPIPLYLWDRKNPYKRYLDTQTGISPLAFAPDKDAVIKINSYEHDESGYTTEDPVITKSMQEKRKRKQTILQEELARKFSQVNVIGNSASVAILCFGSNKGVCVEVAKRLKNIKIIQPIILMPFPLDEVKKALKNVKKVIAIENNSTAELKRLVESFGLEVHASILKYDGRPFSISELEEKVQKELL